MLLHENYEDDGRVRREADALAAAGHAVTVVALREHGRSATDQIGAVRVVRLPIRHVQGRGIVGYLLEYGAFMAGAAFTAARLHHSQRFGLIHVHTLPDTLVFAALPIRMTGVPVILDFHEAMPVFFGSRFPGRASRLATGVLEVVERAAAACTEAVVTVNGALADRLVAQGVSAERIHVIRNSPDLRLFDRRAFPPRAFMEDGTLRLVYAGSLTPIYEVDVIARAVSLLLRGDRDVPALGAPIRFDVYGDGDELDRLRGVVTDLGLETEVRFHGRIPIEEVPSRIAAADIGVAPTRLDAYSVLSLSTKVLEYAAMGKPVLASRLPTVEREVGEAALAIYEPGSALSAAREIRSLVDDPVRRAEVIETAEGVVRIMAWDHEAERLVALVDRLIRRAGAW